MKVYHIGVSGTALPSYQSAAEYLEGKTYAGWSLIGWTIARAALIGLPFPFLGIPIRLAAVGALTSSSMISVFALLRIKNQAEK
jgi:hypothetical protein